MLDLENKMHAESLDGDKAALVLSMKLKRTYHKTSFAALQAAISPCGNANRVKTHFSLAVVGKAT